MLGNIVSQNKIDKEEILGSKYYNFIHCRMHTGKYVQIFGVQGLTSWSGVSFNFRIFDLEAVTNVFELVFSFRFSTDTHTTGGTHFSYRHLLFDGGIQGIGNQNIMIQLVTTGECNLYFKMPSDYFSMYCLPLYFLNTKGTCTIYDSKNPRILDALPTENIFTTLSPTVRG